MVERFVYNTGTISIANGAQAVTGIGTSWLGRDWAGAGIWVIPAAAAPFKVGTVAEVTPRGIYEALELPLVSVYGGTSVVSQPYELVDGAAIANGSTQAAIYARFAAFLETNMGLAGNLADDITWALVPQNTMFVDSVTRKLYQWRNGVLEEVYSVSLPFNPMGPWVEAGTRFALAVVASEVDVDFDDGPLYELDVALDFELQLPTNVAVNDEFSILFTITDDTPVPAITFDPGFTGVSAASIRTALGNRTQLRFTVTAETGGTATAVTVEEVTYDENALVTDGEYSYVSNIDDNFDEPDTGGESDASWTVLPLVQGDPGAAVVTATSDTSLSISAASKVFTLAEATERGYGVGTRLRAASDADPAVDWMEGVVTAYVHPTLTVLMDLVAAGSGTHADWTISIAGERGQAGGGLTDVVNDTTPQAGGTFDMNAKQMRYSKGADVASANALALGNDGNYFDITGTTAITSIGTKAVGTQVKLQFDGILTLTHHATDLILPTGANIVTAAGDHAEFTEYASGDWRCDSYTRADGRPLASIPGSETVVGGFEKATLAELYAATADKAVTSDLLETASALVALTDASPVAVNWDSGVHFSLTITANRQIDNPTNGQPGTYRTILVQGNDATDRTITFDTEFLGDIPVITDCDSTKWYLLTIRCITASHFVVTSMVAKKP